MMSAPAKAAMIGCDVVAGIAVLGSLAGYLPNIAAGCAVLYYLIMFVAWVRSRLK